MPDHDNDIDALNLALENLRQPEHWRSILTALVADRDALKQRVAELEATIREMRKGDSDAQANRTC